MINGSCAEAHKNREEADSLLTFLLQFLGQDSSRNYGLVAVAIFDAAFANKPLIMFAIVV